MSVDESPPLEVVETQVRPPIRIGWRVWFWQRWRKIWIATAGTTVLLLGIAMLVLPGPGWLTIFAGMTILATEFAWARWLMTHAQARLQILAPWLLPMTPPPPEPLVTPRKVD